MALVVKNSPANAGELRDAGSNPGWGGFPGRGNGNPLQHSCLENLMGREAWRATIQGVAESDMTKVTYHTLLKRGPWKEKKKLRYCKSQIKALMSDGYHFNIHQMSFIPQWRNSTTEKVNIDEQKRWERDAADDRAGCWAHIRAVFCTLEGSFKRKPEDLLPQQTDKGQPAFWLPSHFGLRDGSVKRWVFIQNTDSQALNWAWESVLFSKKVIFIYLFLWLCWVFVAVWTFP